MEKMQMENSTREGVSIQERLEGFLAAEEPQAQPQADAPEPEVKADPAEPSVEPEGDGEEVPEPSVSLSDLAQYLGIDEAALDVDDDGKVALKTKVDGQEGKAKLADLLTSYQLRGHLDNETRAVAEQKKALAAHMAGIEQAVQAKVQHLESLAQAAQNELVREYQGIDWQTLRATDPAEYAALQADYQHRVSRIGNMIQTAQAERQQLEQAQWQRTEQGVAEEAQRLPDLIPEWKDQDVANRERSEIMDWGLKAGIPAQELKTVQRAAHVAVLRKAMLYDKLQTSKAEVERKVRAAPKLVKPGQSTEAGQREEQTIRGLKSNIKKSGGKSGIAEYLLATGKV